MMISLNLFNRYNDAMINAGITTVAAVKAADTQSLEALLNKLGARKLKRASMGLPPTRRNTCPVSPSQSLLRKDGVGVSASVNASASAVRRDSSPYTSPQRR